MSAMALQDEPRPMPAMRRRALHAIGEAGAEMVRLAARRVREVEPVHAERWMREHLPRRERQRIAAELRARRFDSGETNDRDLVRQRPETIGGRPTTALNDELDNARPRQRRQTSQLVDDEDNGEWAAPVFDPQDQQPALKFFESRREYVNRDELRRRFPSFTWTCIEPADPNDVRAAVEPQRRTEPTRWTCDACGRDLPAQRGGRPRRYCSDLCRQRASRSRRA